MSELKEKIASCIDHTSLNNYDSEKSIIEFVSKARGYLLQPATIAVYPAMVETVGLTLGESEIGITAVCGAFPSGLTYLEVKMLEVAMAIENGAEEIDVVINLGAVLEGEYEKAQSEIAAIAAEIDGEATLKVILETGELQTREQIYNVSKIAIEAGANFLKTSTGKSTEGATRTAVEVMCLTIKEHYKKTGEKVGVKVSGGVNTIEDATMYYNLVNEILGEEWLKPELFRIGSSTLLFNI